MKLSQAKPIKCIPTVVNDTQCDTLCPFLINLVMLLFIYLFIAVYACFLSGEDIDALFRTFGLTLLGLQSFPSPFSFNERYCS